MRNNARSLLDTLTRTSAAWRCGDCGTVWPAWVRYCRRPELDGAAVARGEAS